MWSDAGAPGGPPCRNSKIACRFKSEDTLPATRKELVSSRKYYQDGKWKVDSEICDYKLINVGQAFSRSNAANWTLRFKNHKVTVMLLVSPVEPFASIKASLLKALQSRSITEINGQPVPEDASEIEFGKPIDKNNLEKGWQKLEVPEQENGQGKKSAGGKKSVISASPQGAGLKDAQAVAFRFRKGGDGKDEQGGDVAMDVDDPGWDVLIPAYEDSDEEEP